MPKVVLVGDSIRMGYAPTVRKALTGLAEVWAPEPNCGPSPRIVKHIPDWIVAPGADIIHLNCGLHDLRHERGTAVNSIPLPQYAANLRAIFAAARKTGICTIIFALTTPVNEAWHRAKKAFDRSEADVDAYNAAARKEAGGARVLINDLCGVVIKAGRDRIMQPDGVHFTDEGYEIIGRAVADYIRPFLG